MPHRKNSFVITLITASSFLIWFCVITVVIIMLTTNTTSTLFVITKQHIPNCVNLRNYVFCLKIIHNVHIKTRFTYTP